MYARIVTFRIDGPTHDEYVEASPAFADLSIQELDVLPTPTSTTGRLSASVAGSAA